MDIYVKCTAQGLVPLYDDDHDNKKRLKEGGVYRVTVRKARNVALHNKYMVLVKTAWAYLGEDRRRFFGGVEGFRYSLEIAAGHYEPVYDIRRKRWEQRVKSVAFDKMGEYEFRELYRRVKDVALELLKGLPLEDLHRIADL